MIAEAKDNNLYFNDFINRHYDSCFLSEQKDFCSHLNQSIFKKAREIMDLALINKETYAAAKDTLLKLKNEYLRNLNNADKVYFPLSMDEPALHFLIRTRRLNDFITILFAGADINKKNNRGATPLHLAAKHG